MHSSESPCHCQCCAAIIQCDAGDLCGASNLLPKLTLFLTIIFALLVGCSGRRGQQLSDIPTLASPDEAATAQFMTENAPPPAYRDGVSFPEVDAQLDELSGWRYVVTLEFDGIFARTPRETSATARAEVWFNQLASSRRVVVETAGELIGQEEDNNFEKPNKSQRDESETWIRHLKWRTIT